MILAGELNPDFIVWLLQYFTPASIVFMFVSLYSFKTMLVIYDIVKEIKKREKHNETDNEQNNN